MAARSKQSGAAKKTARKKSGAKKAPAAKKAGTSKASPKKNAAKKPATKKSPSRKAPTKRASTGKGSSQGRSRGAAPPAKRKRSGVRAEQVTLGHLFALRPRVNTAFATEIFRTAKHRLREESFKDMEEAARAVAQQAHELTRSKKAFERRS